MDPELCEGVLVHRTEGTNYRLLKYLYHMKYIITEEQYNKVINKNSLFWIRRRYDLVLKSLEESKDIMKSDICKFDDYEKFENKFFSVLMDCLHPYYYDDDNFNHTAYDEMIELLKDLFFVECTEFYFAGREKC